MKINVIKNTKNGILFGLINKSILFLLPYFTQRIINFYLGSEYVGIKGVFSSVINIICISEMGFGAAIVYCMYEPIAKDDFELLGSLLNYLRKIYRIIGFLLLAFGVILSPFLTFLFKDNLECNVNIYLVFWLLLINSLFSYWGLAYNALLLNAFQRFDILSKIGAVLNLFNGLFQIFALVFLKNYYLFLFVQIIFSLLNNVVVSIIVHRVYPDIVLKGQLSSQIKINIKNKVSSLFIGKVCGLTRNTFDSIFSSLYLGIEITAVYTNYFTIYASLVGLFQVILNSLLAGIGNNIVLDSVENNYKSMRQLDFMYMMLSGFVTVSFACVLQPFMEIWMGKNMLFPDYIMILFPLYFYIGTMGDVRGVYSDAAGLFIENKNRTIVEAVLNLILNFVFVIKFGIFGVILATIITLLGCGFIWSAIILFKNYFKFGLKRYFFEHIIYFAITLFITSVSLFLLNFIKIDSLFLSFMIRILYCAFIVPCLYFLVYRRTDYFKESILIIFGKKAKSYER